MLTLTPPLRPSQPRLPAGRSLPVVPPPPPPPADATVLAVYLLENGDLLIEFDMPVIIDHDHPPATWTFGGATLAAGGSDSGSSSELVPLGAVYVGDTAVIGSGDPAARTPEGGYVYGATMGVSAL